MNSESPRPTRTVYRTVRTQNALDHMRARYQTNGALHLTAAETKRKRRLERNALLVVNA